MKKSTKPTITIIGAGITGTFLALLLAKRGYQINIYENHTKKELINTANKKSFNLTFYTYAAKAFKNLRIWTQLQPHTLQLSGTATRINPNQPTIISKVDKKKMPYYTIPRPELIATLIRQALKHKNITIHFETTLQSINRWQKTILVYKHPTRDYQQIPVNVIFGTDGVNSITRAFVQQGKDTNHSQEYATWQYKQIRIPAKIAAKLNLQPDLMYSWTNKHAVFTAFPQRTGNFAAMLILPNNIGFAKLNSDSAIQNLITQNFPDLMPALPAITTAIQTNPVGGFVNIKTAPWHYKDFILLLGDSVHGFFPFWGQGMSAGIGDCRALIKLIDKHGTNWNQIFRDFEKTRKPHMDTLAQLSKQAFQRYTRNKKADYPAVYEKLESIVHTLFPKHILPPLFNSVSTNPDRTADYYQARQNQRKILKFLGLPIAASLITYLFALQEIILTLLNKMSYFSFPRDYWGLGGFLFQNLLKPLQPNPK